MLAVASSQLSIPQLSLIEPTPARPRTVPTATLITSTPTPSKRPSQSHRLLYKGSLNWQNDTTVIPLHDVCFVAHLPATTPTAFMNNPLPLALESMHGRPFLRIVSSCSLASVENRLDDSVDVRMYWPPDASLTADYFLKVVWQLGGQDARGRSRQCVKIALGDEDSTADDEIIVFGQLSDPSTSAIRFIVSRLLPPPIEGPNRPRPPRPDDPLPRRPMPMYASPGRKGPKRLLGLPAEHDKDRMRKKGKIISESTTGIRPRVPFGRAVTVGSLPFGKASLVRRSSNVVALGDDDDVFKVPEPVIPRKPPAVPKVPPIQETSPLSELETTNKQAIKKLVIPLLFSRGISKDHSDFKELYNWVSRGVGFALRKDMPVRRLEREVMKAMIGKHLDMYVVSDDVPLVPVSLVPPLEDVQMDERWS